MSESAEALAFLDAVAALAARLAADDIAVYTLTYHSRAFGSWEIEAGRRRVRIRVTWDGKDRQLRVSTAQVPSGSAAREWQLAEEHDFRDRRVEIVQILGTAYAAIAAHGGA
jgi:hypothetical protein